MILIQNSRFKEKYEKYDDVYLFNYSDPEIQAEIIKEFWLPYITKYINDFGFDGIRMDFAGTRLEVREVEKILCREIERLVADKGTKAIIYAEVLPPAKKLVENASALRGVYTHVTNSTLWGPELTEHERGLKQQITHLMPDGSTNPLPGGTIGFAGSHDNGTNARNSLKSAAIKAIHSDDARRELFYSSDEKKQSHELELAITEQVQLARESVIKMNECLLTQRKRLASTALTSDGGWCLLGGDELGKQTPASVFLDKDGLPVHDDVTFFREAEQRLQWHHKGLIQDINAAVAAMPRATFPHWAKLVNLSAPYENLIIVMNFNGWEFSDPKPVLTIVNVAGDAIPISEALFEQIAREFQSMHSNNPEAFASVLRARKQLIGPFDLQFKDDLEVSEYYHREDIPLVVSRDEDLSTGNDALVWEIDAQQVETAEVNLQPTQVHAFSVFKKKLIDANADANADADEESQKKLGQSTPK